MEIDTWVNTRFVVEKFVRKNVDYWRTTIPENINNYLKHRDLGADDIITIFKDEGFFYVFFKTYEAEE
jgi:hypothetical protein